MTPLALTWTLANTVGGLVGFGVGGFVTWAALAALGLLDTSHSRSGPEIALVLLCAFAWPPIAGSIVGMAQSLALRCTLGRVSARAWITRSALGWLVGATGAGITVYLGALTVHSALATGVLLVVAGLVMGVPVAAGQASLLAASGASVWLWVMSVLIGYGAGALAGAAAGDALLSGVPVSDAASTLMLAPALAGAVAGCVSGAISGLALAIAIRAATRAETGTYDRDDGSMA